MRKLNNKNMCLFAEIHIAECSIGRHLFLAFLKGTKINFDAKKRLKNVVKI